jgi:hypothetical protein
MPSDVGAAHGDVVVSRFTYIADAHLLVCAVSRSTTVLVFDSLSGAPLARMLASPPPLHPVHRRSAFVVATSRPAGVATVIGREGLGSDLRLWDMRPLLWLTSHARRLELMRSYVMCAALRLFFCYDCMSCCHLRCMLLASLSHDAA